MLLLAEKHKVADLVFHNSFCFI